MELVDSVVLCGGAEVAETEMDPSEEERGEAWGHDAVVSEPVVTEDDELVGETHSLHFESESGCDVLESDVTDVMDEERHFLPSEKTDFDVSV